MGARRVEELVAWQLADELRFKIHANCAIPIVAADFKFRDQLRDAASSVTRNIAEGFGRYRHREFAHFVSIARASALEVLDHLRDGAARGYWSLDSVSHLRDLANRTIAALTHLGRYLRNSPDV